MTPDATYMTPYSDAMSMTSDATYMTPYQLNMSQQMQQYIPQQMQQYMPLHYLDTNGMIQHIPPYIPYYILQSLDSTGMPQYMHMVQYIPQQQSLTYSAVTTISQDHMIPQCVPEYLGEYSPEYRLHHIQHQQDTSNAIMMSADEYGDDFQNEYSDDLQNEYSDVTYSDAGYSDDVNFDDLHLQNEHSNVLNDIFCKSGFNCTDDKCRRAKVHRLIL